MSERICNQNKVVSPNQSNRNKTVAVALLTLITMFAEIAYGVVSGSMALLSDGIHMGTHTFALLLTVIVYFIAGRQSHNPNFAFSSGKIEVLGGFANAIVLGITALLMVYESLRRLLHPETILFNQAILVASIGLIINIISALLLSSGDSHTHADGHTHSHHDHNLKAAYLHVLADALTSIFAITALLTGKYLNLTWPDAAVAIVAAVVILKWAYGLLVSSGSILVDYYPGSLEREKIQQLADHTGSIIQDLHIWKTAEGQKAVILNLKAGETFDRDQFK